MKNSNIKRILFALTLLFGVTATSLYLFNQRISQKEQEARAAAIKQEIKQLRITLHHAIDNKQKALNAVILALAFDSNIPSRLVAHKLPKGYAKKLTKQLRRYSNYKNVWLELYDTNGTSLYRSWTDDLTQDGNTNRIHPESFALDDLINAIETDAYDLYIDALLKLKDSKGAFVGALQLKAHFNSISKELYAWDVDSVIVVEKQHSQKPYTHSPGQE